MAVGRIHFFNQPFIGTDYGRSTLCGCFCGSIPWLEILSCVCLRSQPLESSLKASSAGGRRRLQKKLASRIVSVAEDCLSPERTFHGCSLMQFRGRFRGSIPWLDSVARFRGSIPWLDSVARFRGSIPWLFQSHFHLRSQPLESSLGRVPQAADGACKKISKPDRVGRRGLFEPREDFPRLLTYAIPWPFRWLDRNTLH